jgi:hypothetical protein
VNEEEPEPTAEEVLEILKDPEYLAAMGHQITPKGCMAMLLISQLDYDLEQASVFAQKLEDAIFMAGWIYIHERELLEGQEDV